MARDDAARDTAEPPRGAMPVLAFFFLGRWVRHRRDGGASAAPASKPPAPRQPKPSPAARAGRSGAGSRRGSSNSGLLRRMQPADLGADRRGECTPLAALALGLSDRSASPLRAAARRRQRMITIAKARCRWRSSARTGSACAAASCRRRRASPSRPAPFLFGLLLDDVGLGAVALSAGLMLAAFSSLFVLRSRSPAAAPI